MKRPTADSSIEDIIAAGYRCTSRKYGHVTRIDRPDWISRMAREMGRAPSDFYGNDGRPDGGWCSHYRGSYSRDTLTLDPEKARRVPTSGHDPVAYIRLDDEADPAPVAVTDRALLVELRVSLAHVAERMSVLPFKRGELHLKPGYSSEVLHNIASAVDEGWGELAARVCDGIDARHTENEPR